MIDTDVFTSTGGSPFGSPLPATADPDLGTCRDFLMSVLRICHTVVLSPELLAEWKRRGSRWGRKWLKEMFGRKKIKRLTSDEIETFADRISAAASDDDECETMQADCHLIDAALASGQRVVSRDETVRKLFDEAAVSVGELRSVVWVNPVRAEDTPLEWLEEGAPNDASRRLGAVAALQ